MSRLAPASTFFFEDIQLNTFDYRVMSAGDGFRIALVLPDKGEKMIGGFFTVADARAWLTDHPGVLDAISPMGQKGKALPDL
jgi:hypothetical protein